MSSSNDQQVDNSVLYRSARLKQIPSSKAWIASIFKARQASKGGILRRSIVAVNRFASESALVEAVRQRGFHLLECGGQYIILCNKGKLQLLA